MKLCAVSDGLGHLPFEDAAKAFSELGVAALEVCMGNWSGAPHADLQSLLESKEKRRDFLSVLERNNLSGLPAGGPTDSRPNWITCAWPPEHAEILDWQWNEKLVPYWAKLAAAATNSGVTKLCI